MSLKTKLNQAIADQGFITLDQAYKIGADLNHKQKTVERTLNPSLNSEVSTVKNEKGQITGYKWVKAIKIFSTTPCDCYSYKKFGTCSCKKEAPKVNTLSALF